MSLLLFPGQADQGEFPTNSPFPTGTSLLFQQATAPVGWVAQTSAAYNDAILRVMNPGTFVGTGGVNNSSTFISSQYSVDGHVISQAEMPIHTHGLNDPTHNHGVNDPGHTHGGGLQLLAPPGLNASGPPNSINNRNVDIGYTGIFLSPSGTGLTMNSAGGNNSHVHTHTANLKYVDHIVATKS